jgi:DNA primase
MGCAEFDQTVRSLKAHGIEDGHLQQLEKDAARAGVSAPFLNPQAAREAVRSLWRQAFDLLMKLETLERAVEDAARDLSRDGDSSTLMALKADRDQLRRLINTDWARGEEGQLTLPH